MFLCFCKNPAMALCADACNLSWENWGAQPAETAAFIQTQRGEPGNIWEHLWISGNLGPELPRMSGSTVECAEEVRRRKPKKSVHTRSIKIMHTDSYCDAMALLPLCFSLLFGGWCRRTWGPDCKAIAATWSWMMLFCFQDLMWNSKQIHKCPPSSYM